MKLMSWEFKTMAGASTRQCVPHAGCCSKRELAMIRIERTINRVSTTEA